MTLLRFTAPPGSGMGQYNPHHHRHYFFVRLGEQWPHNPSKRLIDETTPDRAQAKEFASEEEAREVLIVAGRPEGWEIVTA